MAITIFRLGLQIRRILYNLILQSSHQAVTKVEEWTKFKQNIWFGLGPDHIGTSIMNKVVLIREPAPTRIFKLSPTNMNFEMQILQERGN